MEIGMAFFTVVLWATMGILLSFPVLKIIHRTFVEKLMDAWPALLILLMMVVGLAITMKFGGMLQGFIYVCLLDIAALLTPVFEARRERKLLLELQDEDIQRCKRAMQFDPQNASAHAALADIYARRKQYELAIEEYEQAIALDPERSASERYKLRMAQRDMDGTLVHTYICEQCGCETPSTQKTCRKCGVVLRPGFFAWLIQRDTYRAILRQAAFITAVIILLGLLVGKAFSTVPSIIMGSILISMLIVGGYLFLRKIGGD